MKICVFGSDGQVGSEILKRRSEKQTIVGFTYPPLDVSNEESVRDVLTEHKPEIVINAAAYTAVDNAEDESELAHKINCDGARNIARVCREVGSRLVHISTDYVYGGGAPRAEPYLETDLPDPIGVYGASKLAGDQAVIEEHADNSIIVRTSSVHGASGHNFVHTMLRLIEERDEVRVVQDQTMSPTWAGWLATVLLALPEKVSSGVVNACSQGSISWYEFTVAIRELASFPEGTSLAEITPIPTSEFPTKAKRPAYSVLDCKKLHGLLPESKIDWVAGLRSHLADLDRLK